LNIVQSGDMVRIYSSAIKTSTRLPKKTYTIGFDKMGGFYLSITKDLKAAEEKLYGVINEQIDKTLKSYKLCKRNFGVLLSGIKGGGKTLFVQELATRCDMPVILVNHYYSGLPEFLNEIDQEVLIIFDEFEKAFKPDAETGFNPQEDMLTTFDGVTNSKKLFVVICNKTYNLTGYLLNRPGRFHYHFKMGAVQDEDIVEYLTDKLLPQYYDSIKQIADMTIMCDITYDDLRAIAFDINQGYSVKETLRDLNIEGKQELELEITLSFKNGKIFTTRNDVSINLSRPDLKCICCYSDDPAINRLGQIRLEFYTGDLQAVNKHFTLDMNKIIGARWEGEYYGSNEAVEKTLQECDDYYQKKNIAKITITPVGKRSPQALII